MGRPWLTILELGMVYSAATWDKCRALHLTVDAWKGGELGSRVSESPGTETRLSYVAVTKKA